MIKEKENSLEALHPGETLREILITLNVTSKEFASELDVSEALIDDVLSEREPIDEWLATRLGKKTNIDKESWLRLQDSFNKATKEEKLITPITSQRLTVQGKGRKRVIATILGLILLLIGFAIYSKVESIKVGKEVVTKKLEAQTQWNALDSNIESFLRVSNVIAEKYSEITGNTSTYVDMTNRTSIYKTTNSKVSKFALYKESREAIRAISSETKGNDILASNTLLNSLLEKALTLEKTISAQAKEVNSVTSSLNQKIDNLAYRVFAKGKDMKGTILND